MKTVSSSGSIIGFFLFPLLNLLHNDIINGLDLSIRTSNFIKINSWDRVAPFSLLDNDTVNKICSIPLPISQQEDSLFWRLNANGKFTVKSTTWLQNKSNTEGLNSELLKKMWKLNISNKIK